MTSLDPLGNSRFELLEAYIDQDDMMPSEGGHRWSFAVADRDMAAAVIDNRGTCNLFVALGHIWTAASFADNVVVDRMAAVICWSLE